MTGSTDKPLGASLSAIKPKPHLASTRRLMAIHQAPLPDMPTAKPQGRPTKYTKAIADRVIEAMYDGRSLRVICMDEGMPSRTTILGWASDNRDGFSDRYQHAREAGYDAMAEYLLWLADEGTGDVNRDRLSSDNRKWLLSKLAARKYGDKLEVSGELTITKQDSATLEAKLAAMLAKANVTQDDPQ